MPPKRSAERGSLKFLLPLFNYVKKYKFFLALAVIFAVAGTVFTILGPHYISNITDLIEEGLKTGAMDLEAVSKIGVMLCVMFGISLVCQYLQGFIIINVTERTSFGLRRDVVAKINKLPLKIFDNTAIGNILSLITSDIDMIGQTMTQSVGSFFQYLTQFIGVFFIMLFTNWLLTAVAVGAAVLGIVILLFIMSHSQKYFIEQQQQIGRLNGHNEEIYNGQSIVKVYNAVEEEKMKFTEINNGVYNAGWKSMFFGSMLMPIMGFVGNFGYVAVCVVGAVLALNGQITFGVIVSFMMYIRFFTNPLSQFGMIFTQLQTTAAASKRVFAFLKEEELEDDSYKEIQIPDGKVKGEVKFEHVKFGYYPGTTIINDFNAVAKPGQKIAIVGPTGAGKTTLVNLLMRFYEIDEGKIEIDGHNLKDMRRSEVHSLFGMVLQDTWLFEGTFRENIKYNLDVTDEEMYKAAKLSGIDHFIRTTPKGYDTVLNEDANVSAGQRQLITIARAMVENAPFLILDEATSSVDTRTEEVIQEAMDTLMKGRTSFIIAHRLSTIRNADLILVMNHGDIIEQGNHEELMKQGGFYADLYNSQFESVE